MLKVIFFTKALVSEGGAERLLFEVADSFQKSGMEVKIVTISSTPLSSIFNGKYDKFSITAFSNNAYPSTNFRKIFVSLVAIFKLRKFIKEFKPDIILGQNPADSEMLYLGTIGTRYIYSIFIHGTFFCFPNEQLKYYGPFKKSFALIKNSLSSYEQFIPPYRAINSFISRFLLTIRSWMHYVGVRGAKMVFSLSQRMANEVKLLYGRNAIALKCGIDSSIFDYELKLNVKEKYGVGQNKKMIVDVSRLVVGKRLDISIKAFSLLLKENQNIYFVIAGKGPEKENLEKLIEELHITKNVIMAGYVPDTELWDLYKSTDLLLHPAFIDFDITVMEGLALGTKVLVASEYDISGSLEKLEDILLFSSPHDPEKIAEIIEKVLNTTNQDIDYKKVLEEYIWKNYSKKLMEFLR